MANFKFFNIGKANEEITRLETELATAQAALATSTENASAVEANAETLKAKVAELETASTSVAALTSENQKLSTDLAAANAKLANPGEQITIKASQEALKITQAQGQPPIAATASASGAGGDILAQHAAIKDPAQKMAFYRKNKTAFDSAWKAANPVPE